MKWSSVVMHSLNSNGRILDLVLFGRNWVVGRSFDPLVALVVEDPQHPALTACFSLGEQPRTKYNFPNGFRMTIIS